MGNGDKHRGPLTVTMFGSIAVSELALPDMLFNEMDTAATMCRVTHSHLLVPYRPPNVLSRTPRGWVASVSASCSRGLLSRQRHHPS